MLKKIMTHKRSSILIPIFGFSCQVILWMFVFIFTVFFHSVAKNNLHHILENITLIGATIVFFMPLISLLGIYLSIRNIIKKDSRPLNTLALILNLIWFSLFVVISWLVLIVRVSA